MNNEKLKLAILSSLIELLSIFGKTLLLVSIAVLTGITLELSATAGIAISKLTFLIALGIVSTTIATRLKLVLE